MGEVLEALYNRAQALSGLLYLDTVLPKGVESRLPLVTLLERFDALSRVELAVQLGQRSPRHVGAATDDTYRRIDLVGQAGYQLAQRSHLLHLDQVRLGTFQFFQGSRPRT